MPTIRFTSGTTSASRFACSEKSVAGVADNFEKGYAIPNGDTDMVLKKFDAEGGTGTDGRATLTPKIDDNFVTGDIDPVANHVFDIEFEFVVRAVGASGTVVGSGRCLSGARATAAPVLHMLATGTAATSTTTVDTTAAIVLAISLDRQATATDGDSMRLDRFNVEVIG